MSRACSILRIFVDDKQTMTLSQVVEQTGLEQTICFRLLRTLEEEGFLRRISDRKYSSNVHIFTERRFRIGYASQAHDSFSSAISQGLRWAATGRQIDLVELDNQYSATAALRNAEQLIKQRVDLAIEFQTYERIGAKISHLFETAGIPIIAVEIPHPNATFLGVDNHRAGMLAGKALLRFAKKQWNGECDEIVFLDLDIAGSLPHLRLAGAQSVLRKGLDGACTVTHLESRGEFVRSFELTRKHLQLSPKRRTLLIGVNDFAVLGALRAFEEAGRSHLCSAVSHGAGPEARRELRLPNSRLIASIAFFPEHYGDSLLLLALDILNQRTVPPAVYMPVQVITSQNVDDVYPKDIFANSDRNDVSHS